MDRTEHEQDYLEPPKLTQPVDKDFLSSPNVTRTDKNFNVKNKMQFLDNEFWNNNGMKVKYKMISGSYQMLLNDFEVAFSSVAITPIITLPKPSIAGLGKTYIIKDASGGAGSTTITINPNALETIDGAASVTISANYGVVQLITDGTNWFTNTPTQAGVTGILSGGTGTTVFTPYAVVLGPKADNLTLQDVGGTGVLGTVLTSQGAGVVPAWNNISLIPAWKDEGTLTWTAETTDKTLNPVTSGRDIYMIVFHMDYQTASAGNFLDFQLNGDTSNNYYYVPFSSSFAALAGPATAIRLATVNANLKMSVTGTIYVKGTLGSGLANDTLGVSGVIQPNQLNGTPVSVMYVGELVSGLSSVTSFTFKVNGKTVTGKVHVYSLNI